jgi:hypothetical protein
MAKAVKQTRQEKVDAVLNGIVDLFTEGDVAKAVAIATFPIPDIPLAKWSLRNRVIAMIAGTGDARGFRQWESVGRCVQKGKRAFYILAPLLVKSKTGEVDKNGKPRMVCIGFKAVPVFRASDTEGDPINYPKHELPAHPLSEVAEAWGIDVQTAGFSGHAYGWTDGKGNITLCTPNERTFFHELGHCADARTHKLKGGQDAVQEIVAELTAATLARLVGREMPNDGRSREYVAGYARKLYPNLSDADAMRKACERVLARTCKAVEAILKAAADPVAAKAEAAKAE